MKVKKLEKPLVLLFLLFWGDEIHCHCAHFLKKFEALVVTGPTTSGKTKLAMGFAHRYAGHIVNSDRLYFFRFFKLGTGKSDLNLPKERTHLFDILDPADDFLSEEKFLELLQERLDYLKGRGDLAIIEGTSSVYTPLLANEFGNRFRWIGVLPQKQALLGRINHRIENAIALGLLDEVKLIDELGLRNSPAVQISVVYPYFLDYLDGKRSLENAKFSVTAKILKLVDEQLLWLNSIPNIEWQKPDSEKTF